MVVSSRASALLFMYDVTSENGGTGRGGVSGGREGRERRRRSEVNQERVDTASLVLGLGDWGRLVLARVQAGRDRPHADGLTALQIDHASAVTEDSTPRERFLLGLPRSFDPSPHVWMPSESLTHTPFELGILPDRARARLLLSTSQRQLRGFLSLPIHRLVSRLEGPSSGLEVLICASLSDVLGSGIFLDLAHVLREIATGDHEVSIGALLAFPDARAFAEEDPTLWQARAYAALLELNHFSTEGAPFSLHDHLGQEHLAQSGPPLDWAYLLFPEEGRWQPRDAELEAAAWIHARTTGDPFLADLSRPRPAPSPSRRGPRRLDTFRAVTLRVPGTGMPQLTAIQLSRRALARWTRSGPSLPLDSEGRRIMTALRERITQQLVVKESTAWLADINERCQQLTLEVEQLLDSSFDAGARAWRLVRRLERLVYADLDRGGKVWREARGQMSVRFVRIADTVAEEIDHMLSRPSDGHHLAVRAYDELQNLRNERIRDLTQRITDMGKGEATTRLRAARSDLRSVTHSEPGLFGRLRGRTDVKLMSALGEWVRWMPRFAMQERERALAQIEIELLQDLLGPVEKHLATARLWAEELGTSLDGLEQDLVAGLFEVDDGTLRVMPGGSQDPRQAARHLCEELLGLFPEAAELPLEITDPAQMEAGNAEEGARRLGRWAMPLCASVSDRLTIDAVLAGVTAGTATRAVLDKGVARWLMPLLERDREESPEVRLAVALPGHAIGSQLQDWLVDRAVERGLPIPEVVGVAPPNEAVLFRAELGFPAWRLGHMLESLRESYETMRFAADPASLHTRADVPDWTPLKVQDP